MVEKRVCHTVGELGVVDVKVELDQFDVLSNVLADCREQSLVRMRIMKGLTLRVHCAHPAQRDQKRGRTRTHVELVGDDPTQASTFGRSRSHQSDVRIVSVQLSGPERIGNALHTAEVHHIERTQRYDLRNADATRGL